MKTKCQCRECGKTWDKGEQGDNEKLCLRCERSQLHEQLNEDEIEIMDRAYPASDDIWDEGY